METLCSTKQNLANMLEDIAWYHWKTMDTELKYTKVWIVFSPIWVHSHVKNKDKSILYGFVNIKSI